MRSVAFKLIRQSVILQSVIMPRVMAPQPSHARTSTIILNEKLRSLKKDDIFDREH